jgi:glucose dehydrogenase
MAHRTARRAVPRDTALDCNPQAQRRSAWRWIQKCFLMLAALTTALTALAALDALDAAARAANTAPELPGADTLLRAGQDDVNWVPPAKTYAGNRYSALTQVNSANVATLRQAWRTDIADDGQQEASPIIWNGTMYLSTQTIPVSGQPGHETWPGASWKDGGGAVWSGIAVDQGTDTLFVAPGNPGPASCAPNAGHVGAATSAGSR